MNLPFDAFFCADYIRKSSPDIIPENIRAEQVSLGVPCLGPLGCRLLCLYASIAAPRTAVDVGCGIGASTTAIHMGAPDALITALDGNIERTEACRRLINSPKINVRNALAVPYLENTREYYDFAFVDSVKKMYLPIWHTLRKRLNPGAVVIFDDVLLYGYTAEPEATVPEKYRDGRRELRDFIAEISSDKTLHSQIIPIEGGMLVLKLKL